MNEQAAEALKRGAIDGIIAALVAFFAYMQLPDAVLEQSWIVAGGAFSLALSTRWAEGMWDARRAARVRAGLDTPIPADVR